MGVTFITDAEYKPVKKTEEMTQPVGVSDDGQLWTSLGGSGGVGEFCITVTDKDTGGYAIDKTVTEITDAFVAGKLLYCKYGDTRVPLVKAVPTTVSSGVRYDEWYFMAVTDDATSTKVYIKASYRGTTLRSTTVTLTTTNYLIDYGKEDGLFAFMVNGNRDDGYTLSLFTGGACTAEDVSSAVLEGRNCLCYCIEADAAMPFTGLLAGGYSFGTTANVGDGVANVTVLIGSDGNIAVNISNLSGGSGGSGGSGTFYVVVIEGDADNGYRIAGALKAGYVPIECTYNNVVNWFSSGDTVVCMYEEIAYPLLVYALDGGLVFGATLITDGAALCVGITLSPDGTVEVGQSLTELGGGSSGDVEIPETLPNPYGLTFESEAGVELFTYDGSSARSVTLPSFLPNPEPLYINDQLYDGTEAVEVTIGSMSVNVQDNGDGTYTASTDFQTILSALENTTVTVLMQGESYTTANVFQLSGIEMTPDETGEDISSMTLTFAHEEGSTRHLLHFHMDDTITYEVIEGGSCGVDEEAVSAIIAAAENSVKAYGAKGDGVTDDTAAFQTALAEKRTVKVPGGTYKLSGTLIIRENCCLELSQDTVLRFADNVGDIDCIELRGSATLRGNHAIIAVPYAFSGHVIDIDTLDDNDFDNQGLHATIVPPYSKPGPMYKCQRFIYDVNIIKFIDNYGDIGFCASSDGTCSGTGVYISATNVPKSDSNPYNNDLTCLWATTFSGVRIAGGFSYGIHAINYDSGAPSPEGYEDDGWNHDMRIEAIIEGCEIGVALENCNGARLAVTIQPKPSQYSGNVAYAKYGFYLNDSRFVDLSGSRVWDWHTKDKNGNTVNSKWELGNEFQHIAMIGQCRGLILDDFMYYESGTDIRDLIYTNLPSNLEKMTIIQEPITRWFKPVDGKPYFSDGSIEKPLMLREEMDEFFAAERIQGYANALSSAIDTDGSIYKNIGYARNGGALNSAGTLVADTEAWYGHSGFIKCKTSDILYFKNFNFGSDGYTKAFAYDANFNLLGQNNIIAILDGTTPGVFSGSLTDDGCIMNVVRSDTAYMRISFKSTYVGSDPIISVNNEIKFVQSGFLAEGINVRGAALVLNSPGGKSFRLSVSDSGILTASEIGLT